MPYDKKVAEASRDKVDAGYKQAGMCDKPHRTCATCSTWQVWNCFQKMEKSGNSVTAKQKPAPEKIKQEKMQVVTVPNAEKKKFQIIQAIKRESSQKSSAKQFSVISIFKENPKVAGENQ